MISTIQEQKKNITHVKSSFALFCLGFRPFFLFGSIYGIIVLSYFILLISGAVETLPSALDAISWHRHEMLFGYVGAVIAGFLFTAVPNWTGHATPKGLNLALVVLLWFAGRVVMFISAYLPAMLVGAIDVSFFIICAVCIFPALFKSKNRRNYFFIALLILLALANALTHWGNSDTGIILGRNIIILMMVLIGGRVIPFFTERPLGFNIVRNPKLERFALISTITALTFEVLGMKGVPMGCFYLLAMIANGLRISQWHSLKTFREPMLWILHAGYLWLVVGFAMKASHYFGLAVPSTIAIHASTAGGISILTLGMMARVSLGHSGRPIIANKPMIISFICINISAFLRVFGVLLFPEFTLHWLEASSLFWLTAFGMFVVVYTPILIRSRADGLE